MGLRKRRKKLTTLLTSIDRRLRSVESVTVPTRIARRAVTAEDITPGVVPPTDPKDNGATGSTSSDTTPVEFAIVTAATYSPKNVTGSTDWMDVTTSTDHGLVKGDKVTVYGLNNNLVTGDGTFIVTEVVSPTEFRYSPALTGYYQTAVTMTISVTILNRSRTTTTATLKLSSATHGYIAGDVITVMGVPDQTDYNGTFFIKSVSGDTITYDFPSALTSSEAVTTSTGAIHSVIHKYAIIGDTWIDTSVTPNTIKVWNGLVWTDTSNLPDGVIIDDGMAPSAPTELSATQNGYYEASSGVAKIAVNLSWTAPTTNADGSTLRDLAGYKVFYKYINGVTDTGNAGDGSTSTTTTNTNGTISGTFNWQTNDLGSSPILTLSSDVGTVYPTTYTLSATATSKSLQWTISGLSQDQEATLSWSTPSSGSGTVTAAAGSTAIISHTEVAASNWRSDVFGNTTINSSTQPTASDPVNGGPSTAATDWQAGPDTDQIYAAIDGLSVSSEIQFAVQAYDSSKKNFSAYSSPLTVTTGSPALVLNPPSKPTADVRLGTATISWDGLDNGGHTPPLSLNYVEVHLGTTSGFTPQTSTYKGTISYAAGSGNFLVVDGLTYNSTWYAKLVAVSSNGVKTSPSVASDLLTIKPLVDTDLIANTLTNWPFTGGVVSAVALADGAVSARTLAQNAITSSNITNVISPGAISTGLIAANAIGADQIAAGSVVAGKIGANAITASTIAANAIVAGKLDANAVTADTIAAGAITAVKITANAIDGKVITGATVRTNASGARVQMDSTGLYAYNSSGTQTFSILASTGAVTVGGYATQSSLDSTNSAVSGKISSGGAASDVNTYSTTISGGKITTNTIDASRILVTDTFLYRNPAATQSVSIGNDAVDGKSGNPGLSFNDGSNTSLGWLGYWSSGPALELGTSFLSNYIDMYSGTNSVRWSSSGTIDINSDSVLSISGYSNLNLSSNNGAVFAIGQFRNQYAYDNTTTTIPNLTVSTAGLLRRTTNANSSVSVKTNIIPLKVDIDKYLSLEPILYNYKFEVDSGVKNPALFNGFIAEDLDNLGFKDLLQYDKDGNPEAIRYDRITSYLHIVVKDQERRIKELERKLSNQ